MSNNSATPTNIISTPKGGGAVSGIGEKFSPDLFTGTGNFTIPISVPSGRNDFQPELNLVYSTGNGNGPFGLGWNLSVPGVSRKTSKGVPVYRDEKDTFILSGAEDLVPVKTSNSLTRYRPRTEGLFARITHHHDAENDYWEVRGKDGLISTYGMPDIRKEDSASVADPSDRSKIFSWKLTETIDPFGNKIVYEYKRDKGEGKSHHWDQLYLKRIRYLNLSEGDEKKFMAHVNFHYEDRPDSFSRYKSGFEIRTRKRCNLIQTYTLDKKRYLIRSYQLHYSNDPLNKVSVLRQIEVTGHDSDETEALPPLEFNYTAFKPEQRDFFPVEGDTLPAKSVDSPDLELADLSGNGLPDILQMNGTVRYWRNRGDGRFDRPRQMDRAPSGLTLTDPGVQLIDADGDGRIDLMVNKERLSGYFTLQPDGQWDHNSFQRYQHAPSINLQSPEVQMMDLTGNGITDALRSGRSFECFFNDPDKGWHDQRRVARQRIEDFPDVSFSDPRIKSADMTGDGLQDIVMIHDGSITYWPNIGHGNWGNRIIMKDSPRFPYGYNPERILTGDVDGDGMADLIYVQDGKVSLWVNQSGNGWSEEPVTITGTPSVSNKDTVRLIDLLGNGVSGLLWSADAKSSNHNHMFFLDFTGGEKSYLLDEMNNNMGTITKVQYTPSSRFYEEDQKKPETRWKTTLPFPVQVVSRVEVIDKLSGGKHTTEYQYHHGYWDGDEREFRGFGLVEQHDTEIFEDYNSPGLHGGNVNFNQVGKEVPKHFSPPTLRKTWFHQGPVLNAQGEWSETDYREEYWSEDPPLLERSESMSNSIKELSRREKRDALRTLRGQKLRTELYALDNSSRQSRPYTVTESLYGMREEDAQEEEKVNRQRIFFPQQLASRTTQWERGDDPMTRFTFMEDYDEFGQPLRQTNLACPRGWRTPDDTPGKPFLATRSITTYARNGDENVRIADRVAITTTYEIENDGSQTLLELKALPDDDPSLKVNGQKLNFYDGGAFEGLPLGQVGKFGALVRSESLVLTDTILEDAYPQDASPPDEKGLPTYLTSDKPEWTEKYPEEFRDNLAKRGGYIHRNEPESETGYFIPTKKCKYDFQEDSKTRSFGLRKATRDPMDNETTIEYDRFRFMPVKVADPAGLVTMAEYDYRTMQPRLLIGPNGNRKAFTYAPLGQLKSVAVMGKKGQAKGDTKDVPGTRLEYDFSAFMERKEPVSIRTIKHVHHANKSGLSALKKDETIEKMEYSDGFGRLLQTRTQGEEVRFGDEAFGGGLLPRDQEDKDNTRKNITGDRNDDPDNINVIVSGWKIYDNKGLVLAQYEPFFSRGWDYIPPAEKQFGQKTRKFYDPRGETVRTVNPDGSELQVIRGRPKNLTAPESFEPSPWETYTYDANDNAGRSHTEKAGSYSHHWNTPSSNEVDAMGRKVKTVRRNSSLPEKEDGPIPAIEEVESRFNYDIRGNILTRTDELGREAFRHVYDLADNALRTESIDAGTMRLVLDAAGNEIERRDSKGALIVQAYDHLQRPVRIWARDGVDDSMTLRERPVYGDSSDTKLPKKEARASNLLGKPYRHYDEAGLTTFGKYDFKGNILEKTRKLISDETIGATFSNDSDPSEEIDVFRVDWEPPTGVDLKDYARDLLDPTGYRTSTSYDALDRMIAMQYPENVEGKRQTLRPHYNRAGALQKVTLDDEIFVDHIAYDAKGQRTLMTLGNGVMTRYGYDPKTFRLERLRTGHYKKDGTLTYSPEGPPLQEMAYTYDLAGNIIGIHDGAPESGIPGTPAGKDALNRTFTYDPLYRLISATGRECDRPAVHPLWDGQPRCTDPTKVRAYTEQYTYDVVGNMKTLRHTAEGGAFTRSFDIANDSNRLNALNVGQADKKTFGYEYDTCGNLIRENSERHFEWDHSNQLKAFRNQADDAEPSIQVQYLYDAGGQRVKKLVRKQGGQVESTVYIGGVFEHHRWQKNSSGDGENNRLHVMDDQKRIALLRVGERHPDDKSPAVQFHLGDYLGSSSLVVNGNGRFFSREEYSPYGETSYGSFARKKYRFTGKERDEESGLYYHGARYYAPWKCRWVSCDPAGTVDGMNLYRYVLNNPLILRDPSGTQSQREQNYVFEGDVITAGEEIQTGSGGTSETHNIDTSPPADVNPVSEQARGMNDQRSTQGNATEMAGKTGRSPNQSSIKGRAHGNIDPAPESSSGQGLDDLINNQTNSADNLNPENNSLHESNSADRKEPSWKDSMLMVLGYQLGEVGEEMEKGISEGVRNLARRGLYDEAAKSRHIKLGATGKLFNNASRGLTLYGLYSAGKRWHNAGTDAERSRAVLDGTWSAVPGPLGLAGSIGNAIGQELSKWEIGGKSIHDWTVQAIGTAHQKLKLAKSGIEKIGNAANEGVNYIGDKVSNAWESVKGWF